MGRLTDYRQRAAGAGWRAARGVVRRARKLRHPGPEVSLVVPFYNVEAYLAECLDSILEQGFDDFEVLLVDDGSPDGSRAIAEEYAARDPRLRLVTRDNGGLGAARNTGVRAARGRYLTFVDSDDVLPPGALDALVGSARETGSEIVCGSVERFDSRRTWSPTWVPDVHTLRRQRVTIEEFLPLLRNLYTWNKLFRRDFFTAQGLWFREGVSYEDQPIITQLFARARAIDVLPDIVYRYRERDDRSSISQQTASVKDLRDRIAAWEVSRETFREELSPRAYQGWLLTLFEAHFQWYLTSPGTEDDTYWALLEAAVRDLAAEAPAWVWDATTPAHRLTVRLAQLGRRADLQELVRQGVTKPDRWPARVRDDGILLELPLLGDPELDESLFVIRPEQVQLAHAVENLHWTQTPAGPGCWISGWAFLRKVDLAQHESQVTVLLRHERTGEERSFPATERPAVSVPPPREDLWCDYRPGRFGVEVPLAGLVGDDSDGPDDPDDSDVWQVWLRVGAAHLVVEHPVNRLVRSGAAGAIPATPLGGGDRLVADWRHLQPLLLRVERGAVVATDLRLDGRTLSGTIAGDDVGRVAAISLGHPQGRAEGTWTTLPAESRAFEVTLPEGRPPAPGEPLVWTLSAWGTRGQRFAVVPEPGALRRPGAGTLVLDTGRNGDVVVQEWSRGAAADQVTVDRDGWVTVTGRVFGDLPAGSPTRVRLASRNKRVRALGPDAAVADGRFRARIELRHDRYRFGRLPLPLGDHDLAAVLAVADGADVEVPLRVAAELGDSLPLPVETDEVEGRVVRGPRTVVRITLVRPLGAGRSLYAQQELRRRGPRRRELTPGVLFRSYFGEAATDSGVAIQRELRRRGSELPVYWAVQDRSVPVPEGGIPVVVGSPEFHDLVFTAAYYVDNMYQPEWHVKPPGQVLVQTFHGYPFKQMGHPHWRNLRFAQARIDSYDERAAQWDYLVSPARYATPLLVRDFAYPGEVLEIGYPRNDVLLSDEAPALRRTVRESLDIGENQTAVLYAPTFRDYLAADDMEAEMADLFDIEAASRRLGDDVVLLVRGHAFNARTDRRVGDLPGCREVTDYPEVSDLYLAADAAVVDYSSLRFDFGVTGKPMVFHIPDLERYQETRGWLLPFEETAPGPRLDTTDEVVDALLDLDGVRREHAAEYERFRADYLDLDDGRAAARFVDAVFVPRGDA